MVLGIMKRIDRTKPQPPSVAVAGEEQPYPLELYERRDGQRFMMAGKLQIPIMTRQNRTKWIGRTNEMVVAVIQCVHGIPSNPLRQRI